MTVRLKTPAILAVALAALVPAQLSAAAQVDVSGALVGKWEGEVEPLIAKRPDRWGTQRTLLVTSARQEDGGWRVEAAYGVAEGKLAPVAVTVEVAGADVILRFRSRVDRAVTLHLREGEHLVGSIKMMAGKAERGIRLKKVK